VNPVNVWTVTSNHKRDLEEKKIRTKILVVSRKCVNTREYPKVSGLAAWRENCKWYSSLLLGAVVSLFCESV
jgi:hypothetical protein